METHFSMHNRGDGKYGSKTTFVFREYGQPYMPVKSEEWEPDINQEFLLNMITKEEENRYFLLTNYNYLVTPRHSSVQGAPESQDVKVDPKLEEV